MKLLIRNKFNIKSFCRKVGIMAVPALISASLWSCIDYPGIRVDPMDENFTGISLFLPNVESAAEFNETRSEGYSRTRANDLSQEGNFNTLYIVAVREDGPYQVFLKSQDYLETANYKKYNISLTPGKYKFYVVANLNRYLLDGSGSHITFPEALAGGGDPEPSGEKAIRNLILNFSYDRPLERGFLPMACLAENIKVGTDANDAKTFGQDPDRYDAYGYIEIKKDQPKKVYADLDYLCAKVRYTILFDRDKSFGADNTDIIDIHRDSHDTPPYVSQIRKETALNNTGDGPGADEGFILTNSNAVASWPLDLDRYIYASANYDFYKEDKNNNDIKEALDKLEPWTDTQGNWTTVFKDRRVWQGVVYLPENLLEDKYTTLYFPYSFNSAPGENSPRAIALDFKHLKNNDEDEFGIRRSMKYDVYALIKTPDDTQWSVNVIPEEWTVQELVYQLHGPYELVVETTEIPELSMQNDYVFWYRSDVPPNEIAFESPQVSKTFSYEEGETRPEDMVDLFVGGVMKNSDGSYMQNENGDYLFYVGFNTDEVPYKILRDLKTSVELAAGYTLEDISYFHIIAGSLHKRINIKELNVDPYLEVTPQTILIDTRELYTSGLDAFTYPIRFETNVDIVNSEGMGWEDVEFSLSDPDGLIAKGKDNVLTVTKDNDEVTGNNSPYVIMVKSGYIYLNIFDIIAGNPFWNKTSQFSLTFSLKLKNSDSNTIVLEKTVTIKVRPFSGSYTIHFRDNTKPWAAPHIYVYQLLTLPSDLTPYDFTIPEENAKNKPGERHKFAGKIVGFIENNPSSGLQWNGAVQYIFSNNLAFRGWKGYGGPDLNNPWEEGTVEYKMPDLINDPNNNEKTTMGFVMFGQPNSDGFWNFSYSYTKNEKYNNPEKTQRYNYNLNLNSEHDAYYDIWKNICGKCDGMNGDYNGYDNDYFYPGIIMEPEEDGWWKYTLSGLAQPGRTMIIFANWHEPWEEYGKSYAAEDNRWPGDYETGLPLFDFEDNDGWLLFDGNTTNADQKFTDDKPVADIIPHYFDAAMATNLKIGVKKPSLGNITITSVTCNNTNATLTSTQGDVNYYTFTVNPGNNARTVEVKIFTSDNNERIYQIYPKNLIKEGGSYRTAKPLYTEFCSDIELFIKWSDAISVNDGWDKDFSYYQPPGTKGSNSLEVRWGDIYGSTMGATKQRNGTVYGNYKHAQFTCENPTSDISKTDRLSLKLISEEENWHNYYKYLKVEDLPQYYNPSEGYYQINWHFLYKKWDWNSNTWKDEP